MLGKMTIYAGFVGEKLRSPTDRSQLRSHTSPKIIVMASKLVLIVFAVILIALINSVHGEELNEVLGSNSREARGAERKEKGINRSDNKKKRRQRKKKKKNRRRKGRKGRKGKKSKRKSCPKCPGCRQGDSGTAAPVTLQCVSDAVAAMKVWKDQVGNFLRRKKRLEKQLNIMDGKHAKREDFSYVSDNLTFVGGGDDSNMTCSGSNTSTKALTLSSLKTSIDSCNATIGSDCNTTLVLMDISLNLTDLEVCFNITTNFTEQADLCMDSDVPCDCWGALVNGKSFIYIVQIIVLTTTPF